MRAAMRIIQVEEQEKEMSAAKAAGVHQSTVLKAQGRALQERQLELDAARAEMTANVRLSALSLTACFSSNTSSYLRCLAMRCSASCITARHAIVRVHVQIERANQAVKQREADVEKKLAEAQAAREEAAQREASARHATAELQRLDKQLSARKLDAKELQVCIHPLPSYQAFKPTDRHVGKSMT